MTQTIQDSTLVQLGAEFDSSGELFLLYGTSRLISEPHLVIELIDESQTKIRIFDFAKNSVTQQVYAHRVGASGSLTAWTRTTDAVESPTFTYPEPTPPDEVIIEQFDVMVKAVALGTPGPSYTTEGQAEQDGAIRINVKIKKHKSRPDLPVKRR